MHVEVVGAFGWPAVPSAIKQACIHLTGILRLETPRSTKRVQDDIGSSIETSPEAERILNGLMKVYRRDDF